MHFSDPANKSTYTKNLDTRPAISNKWFSHEGFQSERTHRLAELFRGQMTGVSHAPPWLPGLDQVWSGQHENDQTKVFSSLCFSSLCVNLSP